MTRTDCSYTHGFRQRACCSFVLLLAIAAHGCSHVPVDQAAPVLVPSAGSSATAERLDAGRAVYIGETKCARCHNPKPVYEYTAKDWSGSILPRMAKKAKLTPDEYESVLAYVTAGSQMRPAPQ